MNQSVYKISLDLRDCHASAVLNMKRFDTGRTLEITLTDDGRPYVITPDCEAVFTGKKPDGTVIYNLCRVAQNKVIYEITDQTTATAGKVRCEIRIYNTDGLFAREGFSGVEEGKLITSAAFDILVQEQVCSDDDVVASAPEATALQKLLQEADAFLKNPTFALIEGTETAPVVLEELARGVYLVEGVGKLLEPDVASELTPGLYIVSTSGGNRVIFVLGAGEENILTKYVFTETAVIQKQFRLDALGAN